ncbi:MAG: hypothetical protein HQM16_15995 [Deltaproteobacteria bacterium]|nr:hypothetical protein [Deltaproteobacteria bacterium]
MCKSWAAVSNVYYSVGSSSADLKTGSPKITINTSGDATFDVAQTDNIGVGDRVVYNTDGSVYISGKTSTSQWSVVTVNGAKPAAAIDQTVNSIKRVFPSLTTAETNATAAAYLNSTVLTTGEGTILNFPLYGDSALTYAVQLDINCCTTDATRYVRFYTPTNTSTEANQNQRHSGVWDANKFNIKFTAGAALCGFCNTVNTRIEGLQIKTDFDEVIRNNAAVKLWVSDSILWSANGDGISPRIASPSCIVYLWNSVIFIGSVSSNLEAVHTEANTSFLIAHNNTIIVPDSQTEAILANAGGSIWAKNNIIQCGTNRLDGPCVSKGSSTCYLYLDHNAASDNSLTTGPQTTTYNASINALSNAVFRFVSSGTGSDNYSLQSDDTASIDMGMDLSSDGSLSFGDDILDVTRPVGAAWDRGAFEYQNPANPRLIFISKNEPEYNPPPLNQEDYTPLYRKEDDFFAVLEQMEYCTERYK